MRTLLVGLLAAAAIGSASAQTPSAAPTKPAAAAHAASDSAKVGTYDLEITTDDGTMVGSLALSRNGQALTAVIVAGANRPAVQSFVRDGKRYVLTAGHGGYTVVYTLTFANDSLRGSFKMSGGLAGTVVGARKP